MSQAYFKLPRLYLDQDLSLKAEIDLPADAVHYFRTVLRRQAGDSFRVVNGRDGEFLAVLEQLEKKKGRALLREQLKVQPAQPFKRHLIFAPLKKNRMDFVIEKAVELGVTDFHPVITRYTEVRSVNKARVEKQIIESLEQCERLNVPQLHDMVELSLKIERWPGEVPLYACLERGDHIHLKDIDTACDCAFLVGPVGGFEDTELEYLHTHTKIKPISLGKSVYRAETASIICLTHAELFGGGPSE